MMDGEPIDEGLMKQVVEIARGPWTEYENKAVELAEKSGKPADEIMGLLQIAIKILKDDEPLKTMPVADVINRCPINGAVVDLSHDGAALDLGQEAGFDHAARYVKTWGEWLLWDKQRWKRDDRLLHMTLIRQHLRLKAEAIFLQAVTRLERAYESGDEEAIKAAEKGKDAAERAGMKLRDKTFVSAVAEFARSNPASAAVPDQFDADQDIIGAPNGYICLKSGKLMDADPKAYVTKITAVELGAEGVKPKRWLKFLDEVFGEGSPIIRFIQTLLGYALTGHTSEEIIVFLYGTGRNGKGTLTETVTYILGDYVRQIAASALLYSQQKEHSTEIAGLAAARLVIGAELPSGKYWDEAILKQLTGGDTITARRMRQDFFDFKPEFLPIISGNSKPRIRDVDPAIMERLVMVPFDRSFRGSQRDNNLKATLTEEAPAILRWMVEGAMRWYDEGLTIPDQVRKRTNDYFENEDVVGQFLEEETVREVGLKKKDCVLVADLHQTFERWCETHGELPMYRKRFVEALSIKGVNATPSNAGKRFEHLRVKTVDEREKPDFDGDEAQNGLNFETRVTH